MTREHAPFSAACPLPPFAIAAPVRGFEISAEIKGEADSGGLGSEGTFWIMTEIAARLIMNGEGRARRGNTAA